MAVLRPVESRQIPATTRPVCPEHPQEQRVLREEVAPETLPVAVPQLCPADGSPHTDANGLGWMTEDQWQEFHDSLIKYDALPDSQDVSSAFTDEFLKNIYEDGEVKWP